MLYCVRQLYTMIRTHTCEQFLNLHVDLSLDFVFCVLLFSFSFLVYTEKSELIFRHRCVSIRLQRWANGVKFAISSQKMGQMGVPGEL